MVQYEQPSQYSDLGTPELHKRKQMEIGWANDHQLIAREKYATALEFYLGNQKINQNQFDAGFKFSKAWFSCGKDPKITAKLDTTSSGITRTINDTMEVEWQYKEAINAIRIIHRNVIIHVCCMEMEVKRDRDIFDLRDGLDELRRHYKRQAKLPKNPFSDFSPY
jgi:isopenicillin N synthase-like dioxygenase